MFLHYYQVTFVPSGMKPKTTWPVIFLRSQSDNQNSDVALNHVLLNERLVSRQSAFRLAWDYGSDLAAVFRAISGRGKYRNYSFLK
jgi:hypothetical protein